MKTGLFGVLILLASCVVPLDSAGLIAQQSETVHRPINIAAIPSEFYPRIDRPCEQDYSSMSIQAEYLTKLDCLKEMQGG